METNTIDLPLGGDADCRACVDRLRAAIVDQPGVESVRLTHDGTMLRATIDPAHCDEARLIGALWAVRRASSRRYVHAELAIAGMHRIDDARRVEAAVGRLPGVTAASASAVTSRLRLELDPTVGDLAAVVDRIAGMGYDVVGWPTADRGGRGTPSRSGWSATVEAWLAGSGRVTQIAAILLLIAGLFDLTRFPGIFAILAYAACITVGGPALARAGIRGALATRRLDPDLLITVAVAGAIAIGGWRDAALVVVIALIGGILERDSLHRARHEPETLDALVPQAAVVRHTHLRDGTEYHEEREVPVDALSAGDVVMVRPGRPIPADGTIVAGRSVVDRAILDGSTPMRHGVGDVVFGGTLNGDEPLAITVTRAPSEATLERIACLVDDAQDRPAPVESRVQALAGRYTPTVVALAAIVLIVLPAVGMLAVVDAMWAALALALLARPGALVVAVPVAIAAALGRAAAAGVVVRGGASLERAAAIETTAFDPGAARTVAAPDGGRIAGGASVARSASLDGRCAEARHALDMLRDLGIYRSVLMTGGQAQTAAAIAGELSVSEVAAGLGAREKADAVRALGPGVAMVGDPVADAAALTAADLGITLAAVDRPGALDVADVAVLGDDPRKVAELIGTARWTRSVVRQGIVLAAAAKGLGVVLVLVGVLPLWAAIGIDVVATLLVAANGLRLLSGRPVRGRPQPILDRLPARATPVFV